MPKIRAEIDVPNEYYCLNCRFKQSFKNSDDIYCAVFKAMILTIDDGQSYISIRLPQCIAAEVKEKP